MECRCHSLYANVQSNAILWTETAGYRGSDHGGVRCPDIVAAVVVLRFSYLFRLYLSLVSSSYPYNSIENMNIRVADGSEYPRLVKPLWMICWLSIRRTVLPVMKR
jgi:hypothetical protein